MFGLMFLSESFVFFHFIALLMLILFPNSTFLPEILILYHKLECNKIIILTIGGGGGGGGGGQLLILSDKGGRGVGKPPFFG